MSMLHKVFTPEEIETQRYHPPGRYVGYITGWENGTAQTGTEYIQFTLKARDGLSGQDLKGVELNRELNSRRFYLSDKAISQFWTAIERANPAIKSASISPADAAESIVGTEVEFDYLAEKNKQTGKEYLNVSRWKLPA